MGKDSQEVSGKGRMGLWNKIKSIFSRTARSAGEGTSRTDTEFAAEVVRVTRIEPHPNADRLELARFEMKDLGETSYTVVVQKGTYRPGDCAAYFSVDCIVPTAHPDFAFLKDRLDGAGKEFYRLKAARLRGVFSQGLLVPVKGHQFGDQVAEHYGVTYHRPEEKTEEGNGGAAPKRQVKQPWPIYGVASLKKTPDLFAEGELVHVTEKIHGTNIRFGWVRRRFLGIPVGWKFLVGSHRVLKTGCGGPGYYGEDVWSEAAERMGLAEKTRDFKGWLFVGELYGFTYSGKPIQDLTYGRGISSGPGLVVFDVQDPKGRWLNPFERKVALTIAELEGPPVVASDCFGSWVPSFAEGRSFLDIHQIREGIVVESVSGERKKAKYVSEGYLMRKGA